MELAIATHIPMSEWKTAEDILTAVEILEKQLENHPEFRNWEYLIELHGNKKLLESAKTEHAPLVTAQSAGTLF